MGFKTWINTLVEEKGLDLETNIEVETSTAWHHMQLGNVVEFLQQCTPDIQEAVKTKIIELDFKNRELMPFFIHLAKGMAGAVS